MGGEGANEAPAVQTEMGRWRFLSWEVPGVMMLWAEHPHPSTHGHGVPSCQAHPGASPFPGALERVTAGRFIWGSSSRALAVPQLTQIWVFF